MGLTAFAADQIPAFPGAEGHGRYTQGGRGGVVKIVTNLKDSGPGSFREAVSGNSKKIVVFNVGGEINLESDLTIGGNTTIAGQTAPGPGITLRHYTVLFGNDNIVMRFIRVRRGQEKDINDGADATWTRYRTGIVLDHCSLSWSIDEVASFYDNNNFTMQWCNITESLCNAGHNKGAHGYGGIWGGKLASFHHNLIAHVMNRGPRFSGSISTWDGWTNNIRAQEFGWENHVQAHNIDFRNCVQYNAAGSSYGGDGGGQINIVNNYYKEGPSGKKSYNRITRTSVAPQSDDNSEDNPMAGMASRYYVDGNTVCSRTGNETHYRDWDGIYYDNGVEIVDGVGWTRDNDNYYGENVVHRDLKGDGQMWVSMRLSEPAPKGEVTTHTATEAYEKVLSFSGASLFRDACDARYVEETRKGIATYTGSITKMPGLIDIVADINYQPIESSKRPEGWDRDGDGIPDEWEIAHGLNHRNSSDGKTFTLDPRGWYCNLEVYLNSIVEDIIKAQNADAIDGFEDYFPVITSGVGNPTADKLPEVIAVEYFSLDGRRINNVDEGFTICRKRHADGSSASECSWTAAK